MYHSANFRRRTIFGATFAAVAAGGTVGAVSFAADAAPAVKAEPLGIDKVKLSPSRYHDNMDRTLEYLGFIDADRLLYTFRVNHGLDTGDAEPCGGWEAPENEVRGQGMGHMLTALAQAYLASGSDELKSKADYLVEELAKCQDAGGFNDGYLSAFPEDHFDRLEAGEQVWAPWYVQHKIMNGLLDQYKHGGNETALDAARKMADWADWRTAQLDEDQMQAALETEFGGMNEVLAAMYLETEEQRYLDAAQRFDHAKVFDPLAAGEDELEGLHANTQMGKVMGAIREYHATGEQRYLDIASHFWKLVHDQRSYANGGNSDFEYFAAPEVLSSKLSDNSSECCNTYNMLKLTRELALLEPERTELMDYYEWALLNQILGQQDPESDHGHVTYYVPLRAGGEKSYSDDYETFWCCVNTGWENHTKFADTIYFASDGALYVNLFIPSTVEWNDVTIAQRTDFPASDTVALTVDGEGKFALKIRIPSWTADATVKVNGEAVDGVKSGKYATVEREWKRDDKVEIKLPMGLNPRPTPDDPGAQAMTYGPVLLAGSYGDTDVKGSLPVLDTGSIEAGSDPLRFTATANDSEVELKPFYDTHHEHYTVYWNADGEAVKWRRLLNKNSEKVLGIDEMATTDGAHAVQYDDSGSPDHLWKFIDEGDGWFRVQCQRSDKMLAVDAMSTENGAHVVQYEDSGTDDHLWKLIEDADGWYRIQVKHSEKVLAVDEMSGENSAHIVQHDDSGTDDQLWKLL